MEVIMALIMIVVNSEVVKRVRSSRIKAFIDKYFAYAVCGGVVAFSPDPLFVICMAALMFIPIWLRLYFAVSRGQRKAVKILKKRIG